MHLSLCYLTFPREHERQRHIGTGLTQLIPGRSGVESSSTPLPCLCCRYNDPIPPALFFERHLCSPFEELMFCLIQAHWEKCRYHTWPYEFLAISIHSDPLRGHISINASCLVWVNFLKSMFVTIKHLALRSCPTRAKTNIPRTWVAVKG